MLVYAGAVGADAFIIRSADGEVGVSNEDDGNDDVLL